MKYDINLWVKWKKNTHVVLGGTSYFFKCSLLKTVYIDLFLKLNLIGWEMLNESKIKKRTSYLCNLNLNIVKTHLKYILFFIRGISCLQTMFRAFSIWQKNISLTDLMVIHQEVDSLSQSKRKSLTVRLGEVGGT